MQPNIGTLALGFNCCSQESSVSHTTFVFLIFLGTLLVHFYLSIYIYMTVLPACMSLYHLGAFWVECQRRVLNPVELELQTTVNPL